MSKLGHVSTEVGSGRDPERARLVSPPNVPAPAPSGVTSGAALQAGTLFPRDKSTLEAYVLWFVFGLLGAHHFYLHRPGFGALYFFTAGLGGVGWLIDLFRMPCLVADANLRLREPVLDNKRNMSDAYTLWFPFGLLGFHHFYLRNYGLFGLYFVTLGVFGIGWLVDLFRIPDLVQHCNDKTLRQNQTSTADGVYHGLQEKNLGAAYMLLIPPLGILGAHHFYLRRPMFGVFYILTGALLGWGLLYDLFRMPILVRRANDEIANGPDYRRHLDDVYLLWFPLGTSGNYHFYLHRPLWGLLYFFTLGLFGIGWLVDFFRLPYLVEECNEKLRLRQSLPIYRRATLFVRTTQHGTLQTATSGSHHDDQIAGIYPSQPIAGTSQYLPPYDRTNAGIRGATLEPPPPYQ